MAGGIGLRQNKTTLKRYYYPDDYIPITSKEIEEWLAKGGVLNRKARRAAETLGITSETNTKHID